MNETWSYTLRGLQYQGVPNILRGQHPLKTHSEAYPNVLHLKSKQMGILGLQQSQQQYRVVVYFSLLVLCGQLATLPNCLYY